MNDLTKTAQFFHKARILKMLDIDIQHRILQSADKIIYEDNTVLVKEGDPGDAMYIIIEGTALVTIDAMGETKILAELTAHSIFGEMAVLCSHPRAATVSAKGRLKVYRIQKNRMVKIFDEFPEFKEMVAQLAVEREENTLKYILND